MNETAPVPWAAPVAVGPIRARVVVPGSKSATARALLLAAIANGPGTITGPLEARDSQLMRDALRALGTVIDDTDHLIGVIRRRRPGNLRAPQLAAPGTTPQPDPTDNQDDDIEDDRATPEPTPARPE